MTTGQIIALSEISEEAGAIVYWRLSGAVDFEDLEAEWLASGLDEYACLPSPVTRTAALKRTMQTFKESDVLVRPLRGERDGFVLVRERYENGRPVYENEDEVSLDEEQRLDLSKANPDFAQQITATYNHHLVTLSQQDVSSWLVFLAKVVQAVRLRDTGGIYFVPKGQLFVWRRFVEAIRKSTACKVFEIPAMRSEEAVASIVDAITSEAQEAVTAMVEEIDAWETEVSKRAVNVRTRRLGELEAKLGQYEQLLGVKLDAVREQVNEVSARLAEAALVADAG